jgi:hypothetical protein
MIGRIQKYALPVTMVLIPFMILTKGMIHSSHQLALVLFAAVALGAMTRNVWIFAFAAYLAAWNIGLFWTSLNTYGVPTRAIMGMDMMLYVIGGLIFFAAARMSTLRLSTLYNFFCVAAILQAVFAALQFVGVDVMLWVLNLFVPAKGKMADGTLLGTLGNPNFLAAYLAICLPFFFRKGWAWWILLLAPIMLRSWTSAAVVPAIVAALWFFWENDQVKKWRGAVIPLALGAALVYLCVMDTPFWVSPRWKFWAMAAGQLDTTGRILFGLGPGAHWAKEFPLHSEWVTILHQFGAVGLWIAAGYVLTLYRGNRFLFAAMLIALINAAGNYNLHLAPSAAMIAVIAGLIERERVSGKGPDSSWGTGI